MSINVLEISCHHVRTETKKEIALLVHQYPRQLGGVNQSQRLHRILSGIICGDRVRSYKSMSCRSFLSSNRRATNPRPYGFPVSYFPSGTVAVGASVSRQNGTRMYHVRSVILCLLAKAARMLISVQAGRTIASRSYFSRA